MEMDAYSIYLALKAIELSTGSSLQALKKRLADAVVRRMDQCGGFWRHGAWTGSELEIHMRFTAAAIRLLVEAAQDNPPLCDRSTGANCVNPPAGAQFYPFYTTTVANGTCTWQEGWNFIPGTKNHFGGSSTTEFGPLLKTVYPVAGFTTAEFYNNFNSGDMANPCPVR